MLTSHFGLDPHLLRGLFAFSFLILRYLVFAGTAYLVFYVWKKRAWIHKRIQTRFPSKLKIRSEIMNSIISLGVFALVIVFVGLMKSWGITMMYKDVGEYGIAYWWFSIIALIFIHDTYFYWVHRFMHHPKIFKHVHAVHHHSHNPTPWASFSFHPIEALLEVAILPIIVLVMPFHFTALIAFSIFMISYNVLGHLGYEVFPKNFLRTTAGKVSNTSTHHNMHHKHFNCNYGLYFNLWDRIMNTNHEKYQETFEKVASQKPESKEKPKAIETPTPVKL